MLGMPWQAAKVEGSAVAYLLDLAGLIDLGICVASECLLDVKPPFVNSNTIADSNVGSIPAYLQSWECQNSEAIKTCI